jgi:hypothetical protein
MTDSLYVAIPYYLSVDPDGSAFGIFMDTTFRSVIDLTVVYNLGNCAVKLYIEIGQE